MVASVFLVGFDHGTLSSEFRALGDDVWSLQVIAPARCDLTVGSVRR